MSGQVGSYKVLVDKEGKKYVRLYLEEKEDLNKISEVSITITDEFRRVKNGNLYSYQKVKEEKNKAYDSGYADGYEEGFKEGEDSLKSLLRALEESMEELEKEVAEREEKALRKGWMKHKRKIEEEAEKSRIERSTRVAVGGGRKEALTAEQKAEIKELHELGKSYREIAQLIGYKASHVTIGKVVKGQL